jgi:hypothetical protein
MIHKTINQISKENDDFSAKIIKGLKLNTKRLIADAKKNNRTLFGMKDNKIVAIKYGK